MDAREHADRLARVHQRDVGGDEVDREVQLAAREQQDAWRPAADVDEADFREPLGAQQVVRHVAGRDADAGDLRQADRGRLRRALISQGRHSANHRRRSGQSQHPGEGAPSLNQTHGPSPRP
jgi:hypothetical protein